MQVAETFNWKAYVRGNYSHLWRHHITRRMIHAIENNSHFMINVWGLPGAGKSVLQRRLSKLILGSWALVYVFRVQTKEEFESVINYGKQDKMFWMEFKGELIKRAPLIDIDDKGTIFPSSVGNTKEMAEWHQWWQTRRSDVAVLIASSPFMTDVRKRLRMGNYAEVLVKEKMLKNGKVVHYGLYYETDFDVDFKDPEGAYVSKSDPLVIPFPDLPSEVWGKEVKKRAELSEYLWARIRSGNFDDQAKALLYGSPSNTTNVLDRKQQEFLKIIDSSARLGFSDGRDIFKNIREKLQIDRTANALSREMVRLERLGVIQYMTDQGSSQIRTTQLGEAVIRVLKATVVDNSEIKEIHEPKESMPTSAGVFDKNDQ